MEKLSGLVLDIHDDGGEVFKGLFPSLEAVPELIKCAQLLEAEDRESIPDNLFALVMHDEDVTLRKYACVDAGNTAVSVEYFLKLGHKLPEEAQKTAAQNLRTACGWYGIEPPEALEKVAIGVGGMLTAANLAIAGPEIASEASGRVKKNVQTAKASGGSVNPAITTPFKPVQ
jgi:hypothetical protein